MTTPTIRGRAIDELREWTGGSGHSYTGPRFGFKCTAPVKCTGALRNDRAARQTA